MVPAPAVTVQPVGTVHTYPFTLALATAEMLYVKPVMPGQTGVVPVIVPGLAGVPGLTVTAKVFARLVPQEFPAVTLTFPFCPAPPDVTVIDVDPCPPVMLHPVGAAQV